MRKQLLVLLVALAVAIGLSGSAVAQSTVTVPISGGTYHPKLLTVKTGTTVIWVNRESEPHTVTSVRGLFNSGHIMPGGHYRATFTKAGIYPYYCTLHPKTMRGTLVVRR